MSTTCYAANGKHAECMVSFHACMTQKAFQSIPIERRESVTGLYLSLTEQIPTAEKENSYYVQKVIDALVRVPEDQRRKFEECVRKFITENMNIRDLSYIFTAMSQIDIEDMPSICDDALRFITPETDSVGRAWILDDLRNLPKKHRSSIIGYALPYAKTKNAKSALVSRIIEALSMVITQGRAEDTYASQPAVRVLSLLRDRSYARPFKRLYPFEPQFFSDLDSAEQAYVRIILSQVPDEQQQHLLELSEPFIRGLHGYYRARIIKIIDSVPQYLRQQFVSEIDNDPVLDGPLKILLMEELYKNFVRPVCAYAH